MSSVLVVDRGRKQVPVYFVSKVLKAVEVNYSPMEKLIFALVHTTKRLRRYFQAHQIKVITDQPIRTVLERPENAGRIAKWAVGLGEHKIEYIPRKSIKAQVITDFLVEIPEADKEMHEIEAKSPHQKLQVPPGSYSQMEQQALKGPEQV